MITRRPIVCPAVLPEAISYGSAFSRGIRVDFPTHYELHISGTASIGPDGETFCGWKPTYKCLGYMGIQAAQVFTNVRSILLVEGARWPDVIKTTVYLKDMSLYAPFNEFRTKYFAELNLPFFPASTCVQATLCRPDLLIEMDCLAIVSK